MELIDRQDAIKILRDTFLGDTYEIDVLACGAIESLPTVDAIPIEFIQKKIDEYREKEDQTKDEPLSGYFEWARTSERRSLEWLLLDWKAERDKEDDQTD